MQGKQVLSVALGILEWLSIGLLACLTYALDVSLPEENEPDIFLQEWVVWAKAYATILGCIFLIAIAVAKGMRWWFRPSTPEQLLLDGLVTESLNEFRKKVFPDIPSNVQSHLNRVTLFKKVGCVWGMNPRRGCLLWPWGWCWPWAGWLVVAYRSGHLTLNSKVTFLVANDGRYDGVAGRAYQSGAVRAKGLPDLNGQRYVALIPAIWYCLRHKISTTSDTAESYIKLRESVRDYASITGTSPGVVWSRLKSGKVSPTCILGVSIRSQGGSVWGVVVMDSANQYECVDTESQVFKTAWSKLRKSLFKLAIN